MEYFDDEVKGIVKVLLLEQEVSHLTEAINILRKALAKHMSDEEKDRKDLEKKLNMHTIIMVVIGLGVTGSNANQFGPLLKALVGL